jgi:hypothetical protein
MKFPEDIYEEKGYITEFGILELEDNIINEEEFENLKPRKCDLLYFHVYPNEGKIPHFHIFTKNHEFETCLKFEVAEYFPHGGKYKDIFTSNQLKNIDKWLSSNVQYSKLSIWEFGAIMWNQKNGNNKLIQINNIIKPNYRYTK